MIDFVEEKHMKIDLKKEEICKIREREREREREEKYFKKLDRRKWSQIKQGNGKGR